MSSPTTPDQDSAADSPAPTRRTITEPDFSGPPQPIEEFAGRIDFPQCALGLYLDIRGFAGVVIDIVKQSIKVRSPEGITQSFNAYRLKTLYAPPDHSEPVSMTLPEERPEPAAPSEPKQREPEAPAREYVAEPDFSTPVRPINDYASQPGFPKCAYGAHVDIGGFVGVVVEIVKQSVKVRSAEGSSRSYNAEGLRRLYGQG